jgi:hypothetical protein
MRRYPFPNGPLVTPGGNPTLAGKAYLLGINRLSEAVNAIENLDAGTSYSVDELRDKIREIISALQG